MKKIGISTTFTLTLCLLSILFFIESQKFPFGADIFPKSILIFIFVLGVIQLSLDFVKRKKKSDKEGEGTKVKDISEKYNPYLIFVISVIYALAIPVVGFFVSTGVYVSFAMWFFRLRKFKTYIITLIGIYVVIYILFVMQLKVPFPKGILF